MPTRSPSSPRARLLARLIGACAAATCAAEGEAHAEGGYVSTGVLAGGVAAAGERASGGVVGAEVSWAHYERVCCWDGGYGAFTQYQHYFGAGSSDRVALGYQYPGPFGFEFGLGARFGDRGTTPQMHFAPFASIGLAHIVLRLSPGSGAYGSEAGLFIAFKLPLPYGAPPPQLSFGHGRALTIDDQTKTAPLVADGARSWSLA